jgi:hypothetical protein
MATCPLCLFANPDDASVCTRCGKFRFPVEEPVDELPIRSERTRIVSQMVREVEEENDVANRTVRGPLTIPKAKGLLSPAVVTVLGDAESCSLVEVEQGSSGRMATATPRLIVIRGEKLNAEFPVYNGKNFIGRSSDKPVDIDLTGHEAPEQVWSSRQHAVISFDRGLLMIEDMSSLNGTFVNRSRLHPGQQRLLQSNDVVQIGTVQFKVSM